MKRHGFINSQIGCKTVGLSESYVIITCHYKCAAHEARNKGIELNMEEEANKSNSGEKQNVKLTYIFMGWDSQSLPLIASGDELPAIFTWRAGLDKTLIHMMRPKFDKITRPDTFCKMILELYAKNKNHLWL